MAKTPKRFSHFALLMLGVTFLVYFWPAVPVPADARPNPSSPLAILSAPPIILDASSDSGSVMIQIKNQGKNSLPLLINATDFKSRTTRQGLGARIHFSAPGSTERNVFFKKNLAPNAVETIEVHVAKVWEAGESTAQLLNQGMAIAELKTLKNHPLFNVTLLNQGQDKITLVLDRGKTTELVLKNEDPMTYVIDSKLHLNNLTIQSFGLTLPPRSSDTLVIDPLPDESFSASFAELFNKKPTLKGTLTLQLALPTTLTTAPWPVKTIPVEVRLSRWSPEWRQFWSTLIIFLILTLGGLCSLVLSAWIPNQRRRLDLKEQLSQLAAQIREISSQVDSVLRVAVRMERHRLYKMLFSRWILTPDISVLFNKCSQGLITLDRRIQILVQLDRTYEIVKTHYTSKTPPSLIDDIEETLDRASQLLKKSEPREIDLQTAQELVDGAGSLLEKVDQPNPQFQKTLISRLTEFQSEFKQSSGALLESSISKRMQKNLPGLFQVLNGNPNDITDLYRLDSTQLKLDLLKRYILLFLNQPDPEEASSQNTMEKDLMDVLRQESREALRSARLLVRQMEEGVSQDSLQKEMTGSNKIFIKMDPELIRANQPVKFKASFRLPRFNQAAIREQFICDWTFKHDNMILTEKGWAVSHYFPKPGTVTVTLGFRTLDGQILSTREISFPENRKETRDEESEKELILSKTIPVLADESLKSRDRFKVELLYLGIVLGGTLLGLMAGAKDKLMELDLAPGLIAVFLLGFGADTVKNLLTQRQSQP